MSTKTKASKPVVEPDGSVEINGVHVEAERIKAIAFGIGGLDDGEDCRQAMYLSLYITPPTADQDTAAKVSTKMRWAAMHERRQALKGIRRHIHPNNDVDTFDTWFEQLTGETEACQSPEAVLVGRFDQEESDKSSHKLFEAINALPVKTRQVARRLMRGQSKTEIAAELGVKLPAVSYHIQVLRQTALQVLATA
jgi:DNA-directed RNA polymerase specialized sigma24 family protein